jgi:diguanylate cyclase (GGDEF)-like protein/PAS domain S-box-containing protein
MSEKRHASVVGRQTGRSLEIATESRRGAESGEAAARLPVGGETPKVIGAGELALLKLEALDAAPVGFLITTRDGRIVWANPAIEQLTGYSPAELLGQDPRVFKSGQHDEVFYREMWHAILAGRKWQGEIINRRKDDSLYHEELAITPVRNARGEISHFICVKKDISERRATEQALRRRDELFRQVTENIQEVFFVCTLEPLRVIYVSPAYEEIWGRDRGEVYERPTARIEPAHPDDREQALESFLQQRQGRPTETEFRILRSDETLRWIRIRTFPVHDGAGRFFRAVGFAEDVTARKNAEEELREAHRKLNLALAEAGERERDSHKLTELVDMIQCCQNGEQAFRIIEEVLGSVFPSCGGALYLIGPSRDAEVMAVWGQGAEAEKVFRPQDCWAVRRGKVHVVSDGNSAMHCSHARNAPDAGHICIPLVAHGETLGLLYFEFAKEELGLSSELHPNPWKRITEQATVVGEWLSLALAILQLREVLRQQSVRDPLTGLFNRRYMEETLDRELNRATRRSDAVAVGMCDLDRFKDFNDIFGHDAGDLLLREVSAILKANVRHADVVCRLGGEEFVVILPGASVEIAKGRLDQIRKQVQSLTLTHRNRPLGKITISSGLAGFPKDGVTAEDLLRSADKALYRAKAAGRNQVVLAVPDP